MATEGKIVNLESSSNEALFPRTKIKAISDDNNIGLEALLNDKSPVGHAHTASEVGARPSTWMPTATELGFTGGVSTILSNDFATNRALISNSSGKAASSAVTATELGYLNGVTSSIQTQLNAKVPTSRTVNGKALSSNITLGAADVGALPQKSTYYGSSSTASPDTCNDAFALFDSALVGSTLKKLLGNPGFIYIFTFYYSDSNYKLQIAFPYNLASPAVAVRQSYSGTWKAWTRIDNHAPLTSDQYGTSLPAAGTAGRLFFKKVT